MKILSDIPIERAMKELSKTGTPLTATRQAIETMAFYKDNLVKALRLMNVNGRAKDMIIEKLTRNLNEYKELETFLNQNKDYDISITPK